MKAMNNIFHQLETLKLKGIMETLEEELNEAETKKISYMGFLGNILQNEIKERKNRRMKRNMTGAHFPVEKSLDNFDFGRVKGVSKSEAADLLDFRWLDNKGNILFFGPPGLGKTHLSISLGIQAIESGYTVCFERITEIIDLLKLRNIQRTADYRIKRILKSNLLIIDEVGYTPIEKKEANLFFNLISTLYEKSSIILTSNKGVDSWAEMMGDEIMTSALLDRLLHKAKIFNLSGESYRIQEHIKGGK